MINLESASLVLPEARIRKGTEDKAYQNLRNGNLQVPPYWEGLRAFGRPLDIGRCLEVGGGHSRRSEETGGKSPGWRELFPAVKFLSFKMTVFAQKSIPCKIERRCMVP